MKSAKVLGIVLIVLGILSFAYEGITFTTQKKIVDIGPIHASKDERHTVPVSPILGGLLLVGGVILFLSDSRSVHT
jgi:drug/metabolite transporter (DMT)-like permease